MVEATTYTSHDDDVIAPRPPLQEPERLRAGVHGLKHLPIRGRPTPR